MGDLKISSGNTNINLSNYNDSKNAPMEELDLSVDSLAIGASSLTGGGPALRTVEVPENIKQSGLSRNGTNYIKFYDEWNAGSKQKEIAEMWDQAGRTNEKGIATLNGRYLVAMSPIFGEVGDDVNITLRDGTVISCTIADQKGADATSIYGHKLGENGKDGVDIVEWESYGDSIDVIDLGPWRAQGVVSVDNLTRE